MRTWSHITLPHDEAEAEPDDLRTGVSAKPITTTDLDQLDAAPPMRALDTIDQLDQRDAPSRPVRTTPLTAEDLDRIDAE